MTLQLLGVSVMDKRQEYRELVDHFVVWCGNNHLILNVNKTKEMIVDFRRDKIKSVGKG